MLGVDMTYDRWSFPCEALYSAPCRMTKFWVPGYLGQKHKFRHLRFCRVLNKARWFRLYERSLCSLKKRRNKTESLIYISSLKWNTGIVLKQSSTRGKLHRAVIWVFVGDKNRCRCKALITQLAHIVLMF